MSPASNQISEIGPDTPAPAIDFDLQLGARAKIYSVIKTKGTSNSENSIEQTDNENSGEIRMDVRQYYRHGRNKSKRDGST